MAGHLKNAVGTGINDRITGLQVLFSQFFDDGGREAWLGENHDPGGGLDEVLVEFDPGIRMGMIRLAGLELELEEILGHKVDLNTPGFLSKYYRDRVLAEAEVRYDAA